MGCRWLQQRSRGKEGPRGPRGIELGVMAGGYSKGAGGRRGLGGPGAKSWGVWLVATAKEQGEGGA